MPRTHFKDITGQRFGRLVAIRYTGRVCRRTQWLLRCDCGAEIVRDRGLLITGHTRSCGCLKTEMTRARWTTHGLKRTPEYRAWSNMKGRCLNIGRSDYHHYGGRGIVVCTRWLESYVNFYTDMGPRPSSKHSIDRIDNNGNYEPSNCRWANYAEQSRNRRNNHLLTFGGETFTATDWAHRAGITRSRLFARLKAGWPLADALLLPTAPGCAYKNRIKDRARGRSSDG